MKNVLIIGVAAIVVTMALFGALLFGVMSMIVGASSQAASNPCINAVGIVNPVGGPVRLPTTSRFAVTSEYGMRAHPVTGKRAGHSGIDFAQVGGSGPVVAAMAGVISATPTTDTGGTKVHIDHGGGLETRYLHLSAQTVKVGDQVSAGEQVGIEGNTGRSTGAHLHFEVRQDNAPVDPRAWLSGQGVEVPATGGQGVAADPALTETQTEPDGEFDPVDVILTSAVPLAPEGSPGQTEPVVSSLPTKVGPYSGEQITNAGYVIKAGQAMNLDARTITIGVMTAMGESTLTNVDYGDNAGPDSRGLFQQRANGAWGSYTDRMNPTIAATNFFTALTQVTSYKTLEPTIAAHRTQINADPYHYAPYWDDAVLMVSTLTDDPSLLTDLPMAGTVEGCTGAPIDPLPPGDGTGADILAAAMAYKGTPYSWGGGDTTGPTTGTYTSASLDGTRTVGFDCSGLVIFAVHNSTGIKLPHSAELQGTDTRGQTIARDWTQMQPGDIISFSDTGDAGTFDHVGIYAGDKQMFHASKPGTPLALASIDDNAHHAGKVWAIKRYSTQ